MRDKTEIISEARRAALEKMLGIGAAMAVPAGLWAEQRRPPMRGRRMVFDNPKPDLLAVAAEYKPGQISGVYDVRAFGATGDGKTLDTPAVNKAIEAAAAAGGGTVRFPAGAYLCFSIRLKSNIALYLDRGATMIGAEPPQGGGGGYDPPEPGPGNHYEDYGHRHWHNALIWGVGLENISILGPGLIWGKGLVRTMGRNPVPGIGDKTLSLKNCHNVTIRDISVLNGGHFCLLATGVDNMTIDNIIFDTNRDGMDIDCCRNVRVTNCTVNSPWDDGICPKSSYALGYARATENLIIANCMVTGGYHEGTVLDGTWKRFAPTERVPRTGRIKCGTESNGGFKNVAISNCVFDNCGGLALETVDGALLEDVSISNITMRDISNMPFFLRLGSRMRGPEGVPVGRLRHVNISDVVVTGTVPRFASVISGIPGHPIEDVRLSNITILHPGGGTREQAAIQLPEDEAGYPEPGRFGTTPCYGFYIRHVKGIEMDNIDIRFEQEDLRPPFVLNQVEGADFLHVKAQHAAGVPVFALEDVKDFSLNLSRPLPDTYLESVGKKSL